MFYSKWATGWSAILFLCMQGFSALGDSSGPTCQREVCTEDRLQDTEASDFMQLQATGRFSRSFQAPAPSTPTPAAAKEPSGQRSMEERDSAIVGKSIYLVMPDRFARNDADTTPCSGDHWCGGTIRGITARLDYIQGMGFDCVWITPVVKQYDDVDPANNVTGYHGYWAYDFFDVDSHFGTIQDLQDLSRALHRRGMCLVYDIVVNHVGPIHSSDDVAKVARFNKVEYYNTLGIGNLTFNQYTASAASGKWPLPTQGLGIGAQCIGSKNRTSCHCYKCVDLDDVLPGEELPVQRRASPPHFMYTHEFGDTCDSGEWTWDPEGPCPIDPIFDYCNVGDFACSGYDENVTTGGWFYDLGDLNQDHPYVRHGLLEWVRWLVKAFDVDAIRLDTAAYVPISFLKELQATANVPIIGEVTCTNMTFHAQFQQDPLSGNKPVLNGVLNFPVYYAASPAFCGTWWPFAQNNLTWLAERMIEQEGSSLYRNLDMLGIFSDNHDTDRVAKACNQDESKISNFLVWTMLTRGIPIVYYGTENGVLGTRDAMWGFGYEKTTSIYNLITKLNRLRKKYKVGLASHRIVPLQQPDGSQLVFTRGSGKREVWVFTNNLDTTFEAVTYCPTSLPPEPCVGCYWADALTLQEPTWSKGCLIVEGSMPVVLVQANPKLQAICRGLKQNFRRQPKWLQRGVTGWQLKERMVQWGC